MRLRPAYFQRIFHASKAAHKPPLSSLSPGVENDICLRSYNNLHNDNIYMLGCAQKGDLSLPWNNVRGYTKKNTLCNCHCVSISNDYNVKISLHYLEPKCLSENVNNNEFFLENASEKSIVLRPRHVLDDVRHVRRVGPRRFQPDEPPLLGFKTG